MLTGSCLCGGVRYEVTGELRDMEHCHCSMCRKIHGAAFGTYAEVDCADFRWIEGTDIPDFVESFSVKRFELQPAA